MLTWRSNQYANGNLILGGIPRALSEVNYPATGDLPSLFEADDVTPRTDPHGSISILDSFPTFPTNNVWVEVHPPNFHQLAPTPRNTKTPGEGPPGLKKGNVVY